MTDRSVAPPARRTTPETTPGYVLRGLGLFELLADEILDSYRGAGRYVVPSGTEANGLYEVRVGTRPERNRCECKGFASHGHCSHIIAAGRVAKRSAVCDGCGERRWDRELVEVTEDDDSLTWFPGDRLCKTCVLDHGGIS
ncbi:MAG: hypothetical protein M3P49_07995 [Actinomycetota bacterium]|nr:hypothetical protein [Actinomycetota bacterium]